MKGIRHLGKGDIRLPCSGHVYPDTNCLKAFWRRGQGCVPFHVAEKCLSERLDGCRVIKPGDAARRHCKLSALPRESMGLVILLTVTRLVTPCNPSEQQDNIRRREETRDLWEALCLRACLPLYVFTHAMHVDVCFLTI